MACFLIFLFKYTKAPNDDSPRTVNLISEIKTFDNKAQ